MGNAIELLCYFSSLMLCRVVERIRVKNSRRVRPVSPGVREMRAVLGRCGRFLAYQSEKPEVQGSGENQKQEGIGAALADLLARCIKNTYSVFIQ